ncbi:MAG: arsenic efflux protein [Clostridiales bacterium]|nr:arsenic efflux protein [Clostridiales bacterium]
MGEVFLDAFLDTLKVLPFLLIMNFLIEILEYRSKGLKAGGILKGGVAPLIGTAVGVVPQCGFSVVATELYGKRKIALGTLLAVYIATSDEALPIMLSSYAGIVRLWPILVIKICFALIVGYAVFGAGKLYARRNAAKVGSECAATSAEDKEQAVNFETHEPHEHGHEHHEHEHDVGEVEMHVHGCHSHALNADLPPLDDNATKKQKAMRVWSLYLKHPLLHTATVIFFIFVVNLFFGITVYYVGTERIAKFIGSTGYLQPVLAAAVGLIPNCASSVVITELYVVGGLSIGGAVAGLCVGAGLGYAVLVKQNKPLKNTVLIILLMYVVSVVLGMAVNAIPKWIFGVSTV